MSDSLNQYGDDCRPTEDGYGVDIASQRQDELDLASIIWIRDKTRTGKKITAIDLGGGFGAHSIQMAAAGAKVVMIDIADMASDAFRKAIEFGLVRAGELHLIRKDFVKLMEADIPDNYDVLYSQRAIHYIPYAEAKKLLILCFHKMAYGGIAYISAAGFDTEYGKTYADRERTIPERFTFLTGDMQEKHGIMHKIVTYREEELAQLLKDVGFINISVTHSAFGNIKATAQKL
jgi:hypothetical protein